MDQPTTTTTAPPPPCRRCGAGRAGESPVTDYCAACLWAAAQEVRAIQAGEGGYGRMGEEQRREAARAVAAAHGV